MDLVGFLQSLTIDQKRRLYESSWTSIAVFRALSPLAQQFVIRCLFSDSDLPESVLNTWTKPVYRSQQKTALNQLQSLCIFEKEEGEEVYRLHQDFKANLREQVCGGVNRLQEEVSAEVWESLPGLDKLEKHALKQWEGLLLTLVQGKGSKSTSARASLTALLTGAGLMDEGSMKVTNAGYQFLFMDRYHQLWKVLEKYVLDAEDRLGLDCQSVVSFLLSLGFRHVGQPVPMESLTPEEQIIADQMQQLGLVMNFEGADGDMYFCPTPLAAQLCGGQSPGIGKQIQENSIVVETNYKVYAYTTSSVQVAILSLFVRYECRLPNLFVGTVTRDSTVRALECGIDSELMINYLRANAHPRVLGRTPLVPEVVVDQIRLWEKDLFRMQTTPGVIYYNFECQELFEYTFETAEGLNAVLWCDQEKQQLVCKEDMHDEIKMMIKDKKDALKAEGKIF